MKLIIGGAFQGKTQFAKTRFGLSEADIFRCDGTDIDFSRRPIRMPVPGKTGIRRLCFGKIRTNGRTAS